MGMDLPAALQGVGFEPVDPAARQDAGHASGLAANGDYQVLLDMRRGSVSVFVEQTSVRSSNGSTVSTYPQVCVVEGPDGRVACDPSNVELVLSLVGE